MAKAFESFFSNLFCRKSSFSWTRGNKSMIDGNGKYELLPEDCESETPSQVYHGQLKDGTQIAVKRLNYKLFKGIKDFCEAARLLGTFHHKNLVALRGYCAEGKERMLVFDYIHNSSVYAHLHGDLEEQRNLNWKLRMKIAIGCAKGIAYLHHHSGHKLVHGNIKSKNVLLSLDFEPKIVDYGMAKLLKDGTKVRGAIGYAAPEDLKGEACHLSKSSDVYSFGVLALELITGKSPAEKVLTDSQKLSFIEWAQNLVFTDKVGSLIDPKLHGEYDFEELKMLLNVAIMCTQEKPEDRLNMEEVVSHLMLETTLEDARESCGV